MKTKALAVLVWLVLVTLCSSVYAADKQTPILTPAKVLPLNADMDNNKLFDDLEAMLLPKGFGETLPVIVRLNGKFSLSRLGLLQSQVGDIKAKSTYEYALQGFAADLTRAQIEQLQRQPDIASIEYDHMVSIMIETAGNSFGTKKAVTDFGVNGDRDGNPNSYSTTDVVVAIVDTGIDGSHIDLDGGKILAFRDFVNNNTTPYDDNSHGTHVAGIVAGTGEGNSDFRGVAPGAALVGVKVMDASGSGAQSRVVDGINWIIQNRDTLKIKVVNISLGYGVNSNGNDALSTAVNNAVANGITVVAAAGNAGPTTYTVGSPAAAKDAITVGSFAAVDELGFRVVSSSSRGPTNDNRIKPDVTAPGHNITSVKSGSGNSYVTYSGTSMASPFVAGVAALMLDANYALTPAAIKSKITSTAQDWGPVGADNEYGYGRLQGYEAVKSAGNFSGTGPVVPIHGGMVDTMNTVGTTNTYYINVTTTTTPIAVTMIMRDWNASGTIDFELYVRDPNGTMVSYSNGNTRQESASFMPTMTGTYKLEVYGYKGTGTFYLDASFR